MAYSYDELEWHIRRLRCARKAGKLVFVLGAGINTEYEVPNWSQMLIRLTEKCGRLHPAQHTLTDEESKSFIDGVVLDPLLQAASLRGAYSSSEDWIRALKGILNVKETILDDKDKPLGRIAKVVARQYSADPQRHIAILTFNYDSLIEKAIELEMREEKVVAVSVSTAEELARVRHRPGIFVYHLHGSLENEKSEIVLDAYTYVRILAAPANHWSWSCMNTFLFQKDAGVMFIGLSLLDPSLRLLLTHAAENGTPLSAIFIGNPLGAPVPAKEGDVMPSPIGKPLAKALTAPVPAKEGDARPSPIGKPLAKALTAAWLKHDVQRLFDNLLEELSLVPYHVTEWSEVGPLIDRVGEDD
ncbi:MAG TPA: SIR2 family protein [Thermoanaerobaculia bacterium]|nr:SIR2 family protein [Thermoanaerobaculia bacterium]